MAKFGTLLILLALGSPGLESQIKDYRPPRVETVSYCQLFQHLDRYAKKQIRLSASWSYGFEWSFLSDRECLDQPKTMVDVADESRRCPSSKKILKKIDHGGFANKADITVIGELRDCGGCGHMSQYHYTFVVTCFESYKTIPVGVP